MPRAPAVIFVGVPRDVGCWKSGRRFSFLKNDISIEMGGGKLSVYSAKVGGTLAFFTQTTQDIVSHDRNSYRCCIS
jgi:hypothetical protein